MVVMFVGICRGNLDFCVCPMDPTEWEFTVVVRLGAKVGSSWCVIWFVAL